jgi:prophage regulatory protein
VPKFKPRRRPGSRLLLNSALLELVPFSYPTIWKWMRAGTFPRSVRVGAKVAWYASEVEDWLAGLKRSALKGDDAESA